MLVARRHSDGRALVYGTYKNDTDERHWQAGHGPDLRIGLLVTPPVDLAGVATDLASEMRMPESALQTFLAKLPPERI